MLEYTNSWAETYLLRRGLFLPHELPALLGSEMAREGMRRLKFAHAISAQLVPDPGSDVARVSVLESSNYMRNQLLRDADWAGMAHSLEIRVPLVDWQLTKTLAPSLATLVFGAGKAALAVTPSVPLPGTVRIRAKTGFAVPTGDWMTHATGPAHLSTKGQASREWSKLVLKGLVTPPMVCVE
jgi:asparagine synthase (glutamine-hydrolysing)